MRIFDRCGDIVREYREVVSYLFFGGLTTVVNWLAYSILVLVGIDINISNALSWIIGVVFAFVVNKWFVFLSRSLQLRTVFRELWSFFVARVITGIIAIVLFPILYGVGLNQSLFGTDGLLAKIITSIIEIILNWIFSKYFIFSKKE